MLKSSDTRFLQIDHYSRLPTSRISHRVTAPYTRVELSVQASEGVS